jgi:serpin B
MIRNVFLLVLVVLVSSCDLFNNDEEPHPQGFDLKSLEVLTATDSFGWKLLQSVNQASDRHENVVISPLSVAQALGMTANGADGETLRQMLDVIGADDLNMMNDAFKNIRDVLHTADSDVNIDIANSVWYHKDLPSIETFRQTVEQYYDASFRGLNFSDKENSKNIINDWVSNKTREKIPSIIDEIKDSQYMFLVNAVYFLGKWQYQFDKYNTREESFYLSDGSDVQVSMMNQEADLQFYSGDDCRAVKLPYGNGAFYMVVVLPGSDDNVDQFIREMNSEKWNSVLNGMQEQALALYIPRFETSYDVELNSPLIEMGMELPFSDFADFSSMIANTPVKIDEVKHKTYIKVEEEGTEAAAATSVGMVVTSIGFGPLQFRVDRPFFFAIAEEKTGAILFSGKIENPVKE